MSKGIVCDNCRTALPLDECGDDENGESAGWVTIGTTYQRFDACTIACAESLLNGPVKEAAERALEMVSAVVRAMSEDDDDGGS